MNDDSDHGGTGETRPRPRGGYISPRKPKLRAAVTQRPPRLPEPDEAHESHEFGVAAEDGLRMLAALETMPSLEPEFGDDPTAEAAVTIVEQTGTRGNAFRDGKSAAARPIPRRSLAARLGDVTSQFDAEGDLDVALHGPIEEATVEIVAVGGGAKKSGLATFVEEPAPLPRKGRKQSGSA